MIRYEGARDSPPASTRLSFIAPIAKSVRKLLVRFRQCLSFQHYYLEKRKQIKYEKIYTNIMFYIYVIYKKIFYIYKRSQIKICINFKTSDQGSGQEVRGILQFSKTEKLVEEKKGTDQQEANA